MNYNNEIKNVKKMQSKGGKEKSQERKKPYVNRTRSTKKEVVPKDKKIIVFGKIQLTNGHCVMYNLVCVTVIMQTKFTAEPIPII